MRISLRPRTSLAFLGGLTLAGAFCLTAPARAADAGDKALPPSTFGLLKIENIAKFREAFKSSQLGQMIADPALADLKKDFLEKLADANKQVKEKIGVTIDELLTLPQGKVCIALVGKEGKVPVALLASLDAGTNDAKMSEVIDKAMKLAEESGGKVAKETFKDLKLTIVRDNEADETPLIWTKVGTVYHVSSDLDVLKDYISNTSGRAESLASNENYTNTLKGLAKDSQLTWFLDLSQVLKLVSAANPNGMGAQIEAQLQLTGINGLKSVGGSFAFGSGDYDYVLKTFAYSPGPAQGILKIFSMPAIEMKPQPWVPASAFSYSSFSWNLDDAYKAINELADQFGVGGFIDQAQKSIGPDFDLKKDLFGPLGNRMTVVSDFKKPATEDSQRYLFAIALDDAKAFQNTFNTLLDVAKASPKKREFQGSTIYDFDIPAMPANNGLTIKGPISATIAKGHFFVSTEPALLEQALRSGAARPGRQSRLPGRGPQVPREEQHDLVHPHRGAVQGPVRHGQDGQAGPGDQAGESERRQRRRADDRPQEAARVLRVRQVPVARRRLRGDGRAGVHDHPVRAPQGDPLSVPY